MPKMYLTFNVTSLLLTLQPSLHKTFMTVLCEIFFLFLQQNKWVWKKIIIKMLNLTKSSNLGTSVACRLKAKLIRNGCARVHVLPGEHMAVWTHWTSTEWKSLRCLHSRGRDLDRVPNPWMSDRSWEHECSLQLEEPVWPWMVKTVGRPSCGNSLEITWNNFRNSRVQLFIKLVEHVGESLRP